MRALSASQVIDLWERGRGQPSVRRALMLLEAACADEAPEALAALPVGRRDARLLRLRALTLGPVLESEGACPACGERLEFSLDADDLLAGADAAPTEPLTLHQDGYAVTFRLPDSRDLMACEHSPQPPDARALLRHCLLDVCFEGEAVGVDALPETVATAVSAAMAEADPHADLRLTLVCPACEEAWQASFDIVAFFWTELEGWGHRLLREVDRLARAYGWREADILAMTAWRRHQYLDLLNE